MGQKVVVPNDLSKARYIIDNESDIDFLTLEEGGTWNISNLEEDEVINIGNTRAQQVRIPFFGPVSKNNSDEIYQLTIADPLMKYGTRSVRLDQSISTQNPQSEVKTTGYRITLAPEDLDQSFLQQLPILPDSIRVSVSAKIKDSKWSDISLKYKAINLDNRSFRRVMEIERSVEIKIAPFGWAPVNRVAPMVDWDRSFIREQRYFIAAKLNIPLAIIDSRNGTYNVAVLSFENSKKESNSVTGNPQIKAVPNPVISDVRFEISNVAEGSYTISIKNILGEIKIRKEIEFTSSDVFPVNIDVLRKGSYFYVLADNQGNVLSTKRLIVLKP